MQNTTAMLGGSHTGMYGGSSFPGSSFIKLISTFIKELNQGQLKVDGRQAKEASSDRNANVLAFC